MILPQIIAFTGHIGSGKTNACKYLKETYNYEIITVSDPLKEIGTAFGFEKHQMYGSQKDKLEINKMWKISGRTFLQRFGTEMCKNFMASEIPEMSDPWSRILEAKIKNAVNRGKHVCVDCIRFPDEEKIIKKYNGYIVKLVNDNIESTSTHESETYEIDAHVITQLDTYKRFYMNNLYTTGIADNINFVNIYRNPANSLNAYRVGEIKFTRIISNVSNCIAFALVSLLPFLILLLL